MTQIKHLNDLNNTRFYPVTHVRAVVGLDQFLEGEIVQVTEAELLLLIYSSLLIPGTRYKIIGFSPTPNLYLGLSSAGHKINLTVKALNSHLLAKLAVAEYNTDGTDSFYEDNGVLVSEWLIEVSVSDSQVGLVLAMTVKVQEPTSLYIGLLRSVAHNGIDTLIAVYSYTDKIAISKDGGQTFYTQTLPFSYEGVEGIQYGNGTFVIFDSEGHLCVSKDNGDTWLFMLPYSYSELFGSTNADSRYSSGFCSSCYGNDKFYIIGNRVGIKSSDGIVWESFDWQSYDPGWYKPSIAAGDGIIGIAAYNYRIMWSFDDGLTWANNTPANNYWEGIEFGNHTFVVTAGNTLVGAIRNTDTITSISWGENSYSAGSSINKDSGKVSYNNGIFYCFAAFRESNYYSYSTDGLSWTNVELPKSAYPGDYGHCRAAFGPNGEMYIADAISNSIWINPTPTQSACRILSPTGIDKYQLTLQASNLTIVIPNEPSSYYLSLGDGIYTAYRFPMEMSSSGVIYNSGKFHTILYDYGNNKSYYSTSRNGVSWSFIEFPYETSTPCQALVLAEDENGALCVFEGGLMYWIKDESILPIEHSGEVLVKSHIIYNKYNNTFLYALKNGATQMLYLLNLVGSTPTVTTFSLPLSMIISNLSAVSNYIYVSGYKSGSTTTTYNNVINLTDLNVSSISIPGYITSSVTSDLKLIASTSTNALVLIQGTNVITEPNVEVAKIFSSGNDIFCLIVDNDNLNVVTYEVMHTLQISKLTDEFNNTCFFDFKNILRNVNGEQLPFFNNNGQDYSLTGNVFNFKLANNNSSLPIYATFIVGGVFDNCTVTDNLFGTFLFLNGASSVSLTPISSCDFSEVPINLKTSRSKEVWADGSRIFIKENTGNLQYFTSDGGLNWDYEYNPIVQFDSEAVALNGEYGVVYFTTDTKKIVLNGVIYGDTKGYVTTSWVQSQNYLTEIPEEYITDQELNNKGYLTEHQDISGKVDVTDFEEYELATSETLNTLNLNLADKESDILLLLAQVIELQNLISTLIGHYNELENIIG